MAVDAATVRHVASLARLTVPDERVDALAGELSDILDHMAEISAWAPGPPSLAPAGQTAPRRADVPTARDDGPALVARAADCRDDEVCVPPVIDAP